MNLFKSDLIRFYGKDCLTMKDSYFSHMNYDGCGLLEWLQNISVINSCFCLFIFFIDIIPKCHKYKYL